jgi:hypothetical protein
MIESDFSHDNSLAPIRAIGAMFMAAFGSCWIAAWVHLTYGDDPRILALLAIATIGFIYVGIRHYKRVRNGATDRASSQKKKFHMINVAQWILIFMAMRVLRSNGHADWMAPTVMFIVGLHFLPLARVFSYRPHYLTGVALIVLALTYPLAGAAASWTAPGCLAAGLVLWASSIWAIVPASQAKDSPVAQMAGE